VTPSLVLMDYVDRKTLNNEQLSYLEQDLKASIQKLKFTGIEPAIANLDWTFTPIPSSSERFADQQRFDPPPNFHRASIWPGIDRRASGLPPLTSDEHIPSLTA